MTDEAKNSTHSHENKKLTSLEKVLYKYFLKVIWHVKIM